MKIVVPIINKEESSVSNKDSNYSNIKNRIGKGIAGQEYLYIQSNTSVNSPDEPENWDITWFNNYE